RGGLYGQTQHVVDLLAAQRRQRLGGVQVVAGQVAEQRGLEGIAGADCVAGEYRYRWCRPVPVTAVDAGACAAVGEKYQLAAFIEPARRDLLWVALGIQQLQVLFADLDQVSVASEGLDALAPMGDKIGRASRRER